MDGDRAEAGGYPLDCSQDVYRIARDVQHMYTVKGGRGLSARANGERSSPASSSSSSSHSQRLDAPKHTRQTADSDRNRPPRGQVAPRAPSPTCPLLPALSYLPSLRPLVLFQGNQDMFCVCF